jgi:hypothetical protein
MLFSSVPLSLNRNKLPMNTTLVRSYARVQFCFANLKLKIASLGPNSWFLTIYKHLGSANLRNLLRSWKLLIAQSTKFMELSCSSLYVKTKISRNWLDFRWWKHRCWHYESRHMCVNFCFLRCSISMAVYTALQTLTTYIKSGRSADLTALRLHL